MRTILVFVVSMFCANVFANPITLDNRKAEFVSMSVKEAQEKYPGHEVVSFNCDGMVGAAVFEKDQDVVAAPVKREAVPAQERTVVSNYYDKKAYLNLKVEVTEPVVELIQLPKNQNRSLEDFVQELNLSSDRDKLLREIKEWTITEASGAHWKVIFRPQSELKALSDLYDFQTVFHENKECTHLLPKGSVAVSTYSPEPVCKRCMGVR